MLAAAYFSSAEGVSLLGGSGGMPPPGNFENYRCLEMLFSTFSRQYLGLMNKENSDYINHILCLLHPFFSSKSQSLAFGKEWSDKSSNADSRRVKKHAQQCLPQVLWRGRHFGTCESMDLVLWFTLRKCPGRSMTLRSASTFKGQYI